MKINFILSLSFILVFVSVNQVFGQITPIAEINQIDENGNPTFPGLQTTDKYTIEGIALNDPAIFNGLRDNGQPDTSFILFVQDDTGGIQVYSGGWYGGGLSNYPEVNQGDRVRVTGLTGHFGGKTNINERHNPDQKFEIEILGTGADPEPMEITDLDLAKQFDPTRETGGEYYQGRLCVLKDVEIIEGEWQNGSTLTVKNDAGQTFPVELRYRADIADSPQPTGKLNIVGVFDQEDPEPPFTEGYVFWPRHIDDFKPAGTAVEDWSVY